MSRNNEGATINSGPAGTNTTTQGNVDRLAAGAHSGINAAAEAVHPAIDRAASGAHRAVSSADAAANQATDAMARAGKVAGAKGEELYAAGAGLMREHPIYAIGAAVAAGYLLSRLLGSK